MSIYENLSEDDNKNLSEEDENFINSLLDDDENNDLFIRENSHTLIKLKNICNDLHKHLIEKMKDNEKIVRGIMDSVSPKELEKFQVEIDEQRKEMNELRREKFMGCRFPPYSRTQIINQKYTEVVNRMNSNKRKDIMEQIEKICHDLKSKETS